ncbi:hypothetical protein PQX77_006162 [Marasmius sp. AFHP31]|nr:hypothetical protein PQX77_006162 [Marasmius sp. AFHP31]
MQSKQKTSSTAASGYRLLVERLLSRTSRSIGEFQQVISPVPLRLLWLSTFLRCIPEPFASPTPSPPTSSEQPIHAGTRMVVFAIITLKKATIPRAKRSHPLDESLQPLLYELTVSIRGVQLKDSETRIPILMHILAASQHEKSRAALPSPIGLVPVPPGEIVEESCDREVWCRDRRLPLRSDFGDWQGGNNNNDVLGLGLGSSGVVEPAPETEAVGRATLPDIFFYGWGTLDGCACPSLASSISSTSVIEEGYETDRTFTTISNLESYSSHWTE